MLHRSTASAAASLTVAAALLAACGSGGSGTDAASDSVQGVQVSVSNCGKGWTSTAAGDQTLTLHNTDSRAGEAQVVDARSGAVYAEVEPLGPGTVESIHVSLGAGRYALRCAMDDEPAVTGSPVTLTGDAKGDTPGVAAVSQGDLIGATQGYQKYVERRLPVLLADVRTLRADVDRGDLGAARRDWLPAQLAYLSIGAAYSAFGDTDGEIGARADGFPGGTHDADWHGLHRLEFGLWHGQDRDRLAPVAAALVTAVSTLARDFPTTQLDPAEIAIRAHEITEDAVGFALTGRDDYGAHAGLAEVAEDVSATRTVLGLVRPLLTSRYPGLPGLDAQLATTAGDVAATRHDGVWPAPDALPRATHERVDADVSQLAELLAPVASILEPRRTS